MALVITFLALVVTSVVLLWLYIQSAFKYWSRKGIPIIKPSFPFGNFSNAYWQRLSIADELQQLYKKSTEPLVGLYSSVKPILLIRDPNVIRDFGIKNFSNFSSRGWHTNPDVDPMAANMLVQNGEKWKNARTKISPTFTTGRLKGMFSTMIKCGDSLEEYVSGYADAGKTFEIRDIFARFATNVIASVGFGLDIDSIKNPNEAFRQYGKRMFDPTFINTFRILAAFIAPALSKIFRIRFIDKDVGDFMIETVKQNLEYREANNVTRKDFFQLLMQLRNSGEVRGDEDWTTKVTSGEKLMSIEEMAAESLLFLFAGYESSSTTMSFCLYELAKNPELQQKAYEDIVSAFEKHNGKLTYDTVAEMKYMEHCIEETLRMHAPFGFIARECTEDCKIPDSDVIIEKGTSVMVSVSGIHYDSKYFEEPHKFMPERFDDDIHGKRTFAEFPFLAFGDGPRNCIGIRLGKLQSKIGVLLLLRKFKFELGDQHENKDLEMNPYGQTKLPTIGINLKVSYRQ